MVFAGEGTTAPMDWWLDTAEGTISLGVREMACRLNGDGKNFDKAAANLARTAQVRLSGETLRVLVEAEGKRVLQAQRSGQLEVDWSAADCRTAAGTTRVYFGSDGVIVPMITDAEKVARRQKVKEKRKRPGKGKGKRRGRCRRGRRAPTSGTRSSRSSPTTTRSRSTGWSAGTRGDHAVAGRLMRREAARIRLDLADEKVGNVDGSPWIRNEVQRQSLPLDALGLDFYHLKENAHRRGGRSTVRTTRPASNGSSNLLHTVQARGLRGGLAVPGGDGGRPPPRQAGRGIGC